MLPTITCTGDDLLAANRFLSRRWRIHADGSLSGLTLVTADGRSWIRSGDAATLIPPGGALREPVVRSWHAYDGTGSPVSGPGCSGVLTQTGSDGRGFRLFITVPAEAPGITCRIQMLGPTIATAAGITEAGAATGIERDPEAAKAAARADVMEQLAVDARHLHLITVDLADQTDVHDNLAHERRRILGPIEKISARCCVVAIEDPRADAGLLLVKHAPLPHARPIDCGADVVSDGLTVQVRGHGCGDTGEGYAWTVLWWQGGRLGRTRALHALQRAARPRRPGQDGLLVSNTWGDRNRDARITEEFVAREIIAGADLGIEACQVDDGWMRGTTANSVHAVANGGVWEGFWASDPQFWEVHPQRFPTGMQATVARCAQTGVGLSLWFGPDSHDDFANWERDAQRCLRMHREWGVNLIKLDGIKARSKRGEGNLRRFFDAVLEGSAGAIALDLDITAEVRPGYFGAMDIGHLFLENRYTDWGRWWPHTTLRNLWCLSWYVAPQRLRLEFLNPLRCQDRYGDDPLAPARWPYASLFAIVMPAAPLAWFETSSLDPAVAAAWRPLIALWKRHRDELHGGVILPIGGEPDGATWSGFCSDGGNHAHVIVHRAGAAADRALLPLPLHAGDWRLTTISGAGEAVLETGGLRVAIADPLGFLWVRLER